MCIVGAVQLFQVLDFFNETASDVGCQIEIEGGNISGGIKYGNEAEDNFNFPSRTFPMLLDGDTHVHEVDFDLSGKFAVVKIKSSGVNSRLSVRGFKLKYEMGGE